MAARGRPLGGVKRSTELLGHNAPRDIDKAPAGPGVGIPLGDPTWHPVALGWFDSLFVSGQSRFYEQSDVAKARYVAQAMSKNLTQGNFSSVLFAAVISAASELLDTEGSRRKLRLELQRTEETPVKPIDITGYRKAL